MGDTITRKDRYYKQTLFKEIGEEGRGKLADSSVLIAGCGATGGTIATMAVRAGIGRVRIVDRDFPETGNLGRQLLYDEDDVKNGLPKAILAEQKLRKINSEIDIQGVSTHISPANMEELADGVDLILEGLDNQETRYLLNDYAVKNGVPWVYAGCIGAAGNVTAVIPHKTPCLRCIFPEPAPPGSLPTCDTVGIIGPAAGATASIAMAEGMKVLTGAVSEKTVKMISFDLWSGTFRESVFKSGPDKKCPCCGGGDFEFLEGRRSSEAGLMCGVDAVQIAIPVQGGLDLEEVAGRLRQGAVLSVNKHLLKFEAEQYSFAVFPDGRIIVHGLSDINEARTLAGRFIRF